jgi:CelD/BcsL family acetyltransferase involved in cellulose biosynthesis
MKIETIETLDGFLSLGDEWRVLLESSASDCLFLTHEWLSTWWKHLAEERRLCILTARENGTLIGILPATERPAQFSRMMPRVLEFIGSGEIGSDYLDIITARGREADVVSAFGEYLHSRQLMLQLSQLRGENSVARTLAAELSKREWAVAEAKMNVCPYINLRGHTWDSYLATLGSTIRKNLNRYLRNLPKTFDMTVDCVRTPCQAASGLETLIDLHKKRWNSASDAFQSDSVIAFHREFAQSAAERGWLRILILSLDGKPAAALYGLKYGPTFYFYQSGLDPAYNKYSVGVAMMGFAIRTAIEDGALEYDFLHGDEEYKFHWASGTRDLTRVEVHPPQATAWIYKHAIVFNRAARKMARRVLNKARAHAALNR